MLLSYVLPTLALVLASADGQRRAIRSPGDGGPFDVKVSGGVENAVYTLDAHVGSFRIFNLTLDTTSIASSMVLFTEGYKPENKACGGNDERSERMFFDPEQSTTYRPGGGGDFYVHDVLDYPYHSRECSQLGEKQSLFASNAIDTFNIFLSGIDLPDARFVLASTTTYPLNPSWSSDGIFPLTLHDDKSNVGLLQRILTTVGGKQEVTISLLKPSRWGDIAGGSISFGDRDYLECKADWVSFASDKTAWSLPLVNLQIGSKSVYKNNAIAKISTTSSYLGVDYAYLRKIAAATGARYDAHLDQYTVDCKKVNKLPNATLAAGEGFAYTWDVPPQDYVVKKTTEKGVVCALLILVDDGGWSIGSQFLPPACINFDYANNKIGFATATGP